MLRQARDSNDVYMIGHAESENSILRIRVEERTSHVIAKLTGRRGSIGWTGLAMDREFVYFTWQDDLGDIWVMDVVTDSSE